MRRYWKALTVCICFLTAVIGWHGMGRAGTLVWQQRFMVGFILAGGVGVFILCHLAMNRLLSALLKTVDLHPHQRLAMTIMLFTVCLIALYFLLTVPAGQAV